jgi:hypothetical protein
MEKKQYFKLISCFVFCFLAISAVALGQDINKIERKIIELKNKQESLDRKINQFTMGWDFSAEGKNINTNITGNFEGLKQKLKDEDYLIITEGVGDGSNGISTFTEGNLEFNFRSDTIAVSSIWKIRDIWGGSRKIDLDNVLLQTKLNNIMITYGTFRQKLTPLTLFYPFIDFNHMNLNKAFVKDRERIIKKEQLTNERLLTGAYVQNDLGTVHLRIIASVIPPSNNQRYIIGVQAIDNIGKVSKLGMTYVNLFDAYSLAAEDGEAMKNEIISFSFSQGLGKYCKFEGEFAKSFYDSNVFSDAYDSVSDFAQNVGFTIDRKGLKIDLNFIKVGPFYNALPVYKKDVKLQDLSDDGLVSMDTALPYGEVTPNRVGWQRKFNYHLLPNLKVVYANTKVAQISPADEKGFPCSNSPLALFNVSEWGIVTNIDDILAKIVGLKNLISRASNFELSYFQTHEKTLRDADESLSVFSSNYGLSWTVQSGWECDFGFKALQNGKTNDNWDIYILSLSRSIGNNTKLIFTNKYINYQGFDIEDSYYSLSNLIELRVNY